MNAIDVVVTKVLKVERINTKKRMGFRVTVLTDSWSRSKKEVLWTTDMNDIDEMKKGEYSWRE